MTKNRDGSQHTTGMQEDRPEGLGNEAVAGTDDLRCEVNPLGIDEYEPPEPEPDRLQIGLNFLHAYWRSCTPITGPRGIILNGVEIEAVTKYGGDIAPMLDAQLLGCTVIRQAGLRDLEWPMLAENQDSVEDYRIGQAVKQDVAFQLRHRHDATLNSSWIATMLRDVHDSGQKTFLTFMSKTGSGAVCSTNPPDASVGVDWEGTVVEDGLTYTLDQHSTLALGWEVEHEGMELDDFEFPVPAGGGDSTTDYSWHFQSLDPSSGYKRAMIREIATQVGELLKDAATELDAEGIRFADVVAGIELFNEVDGYHRYVREVHMPAEGPFATGTVVANKESGRRWGWACFHAAWGLRQALDEIDGGDEVPIRLPGISSYRGRPGNTWEDRGDFLEGLTRGFVEEAVDFLGGSPYGPGMNEPEILEVLPTLLGGIDYHYYHCGQKEDPDEAQHIGYLVTEVAEIEQTVIETVDDEWQIQTLRTDAILDSFPVTVMETGAGAITRENADEFIPSGTPTNAPPPLPWDADPDIREQFQALELCRRIGGALASGARHVGWHAWMSDATGSFAGYGTREDRYASSRSATLSSTRLSWYVYKRLVVFLSHALEGEMVLPSGIADRADLQSFLTSEDRHSIVVFRYEVSIPDTGEAPFDVVPGSTFSHAWLVFRDPTVQRSSGMRLSARWQSPELGGNAWSFPIMHDGFTNHMWLSGELLAVEASYADAVEVDLSGRATTAFDNPVSVENIWDGPILLLTDELVEWTVGPAIVTIPPGF